MADQALAIPEQVIHETAHHAEAVNGAAHAAAAHDSAHHVQHELPNFITFLNERFGEFAWVQVLHEWENIVFSLLAASVLAGLFTLGAKKLSLIPQGVSNFVESIVEGFENFAVMIMGERGRRHVPFIATLFIYILLMNWSGLIPFLKSPTASWSITAALAIVAVLYVHGNGIASMGFGSWLHHLASSPQSLPHWVIGVVLLFPLNLVLDLLILPFSLSLRLFANISSEDSLLYSFAVLNAKSNFVAIPLQIFANILAILFSLIQAFVFTLLTTVYIYLFMPHEHEHEHERQAGHDEGYENLRGAHSP